ncbi:pyruvate formate lyase 1-activating protein [uncultured Ferrimonas sp.]|uniref:pyruvate formate lyase 1-activating protein n=1 Tax=uncultured Ferrimonas sp. TaxID=432640 RepID=UPI0026133292|nr:pyruvate formate lyase 1-activating protein [uncultured Ferrimonas sp.]
MSVTGRIHSWETCGTVDGPGIRFIVFTQGCQMRCQYCHNRDTWDLKGGKEVTVDEIVGQLDSYRHFFAASGGGITASGGEALLQMEFVRDLFRASKQIGVHTCLDTNGYVKKHTEMLDELIEVSDLVMLDLKHINDDVHQNLVGVSNKRPLDFAQYLAKKNVPTWIRYVVVPGFTDDLESAEKLAEFIAPMQNIEKVELLPYHELGEHKWETLGHDYPLAGVKPPKTETMEAIKAIFVRHGLNAKF